MQKPLSPSEFWTQVKRQLWPQAERRAAQRKAYCFSLHAPFDDKHPALPHMITEERERFLAACQVFAESKKKQESLVADALSVPQFSPGAEAIETLKNFRLELRDRLLSMQPEGFERYVDLKERLGEAVAIIDQVVAGVIHQLPDKMEEP
jgi:hypothetical protein